jgi:hypothetical protein
MNLPRTTLRGVIDASLCRRRQQRRKVHAVEVKCWRSSEAPVCVTVIEADVKGARLMFPFAVDQNEHVRVSFQDDLGMYQTRVARIAWAQTLSSGGKVVAGVAFDEELTLNAA